jgi:hypothetical protein
MSQTRTSSKKLKPTSANNSHRSKPTAHASRCAAATDISEDEVASDDKATPSGDAQKVRFFFYFKGSHFSLTVHRQANRDLRLVREEARNQPIASLVLNHLPSMKTAHLSAFLPSPLQIAKLPNPNTVIRLPMLLDLKIMVPQSLPIPSSCFHLMTPALSHLCLTHPASC